MNFWLWLSLGTFISWNRPAGFKMNFCFIGGIQIRIGYVEFMVLIKEIHGWSGDVTRRYSTAQFYPIRLGICRRTSDDGIIDLESLRKRKTYLGYTNMLLANGLKLWGLHNIIYRMLFAFEEDRVIPKLVFNEYECSRNIHIRSIWMNEKANLVDNFVWLINLDMYRLE